MEAEDQAWGEHDAGYDTGTGRSSRATPEYSSGGRPAKWLAASSDPPTIRSTTSHRPYRAAPAAQIAVSCGHTEPLW